MLHNHKCDIFARWKLNAQVLGFMGRPTIENYINNGKMRISRSKKEYREQKGSIQMERIINDSPKDQFRMVNSVQITLCRIINDAHCAISFKSR